MCGTTIPKEWPECSSNESPRLEDAEAGKARRASGHASGFGHRLRNGIQLCGNNLAISLARCVGSRVRTSFR